jgi:hypothetical protein
MFFHGRLLRLLIVRTVIFPNTAFGLTRGPMGVLEAKGVMHSAHLFKAEAALSEDIAMACVREGKRNGGQ